MKNEVRKLFAAAAAAVLAAGCESRYAISGGDGQANAVKPIPDAQSAAVLSKVNLGEIEAAQAALPKLRDSEVRRYAELMIQEHQANEATANDLLQQLNLAPLENPVSIAITNEAMTVRTLLDATPPEQIDAVYINSQIDMHRQALLLLDCGIVEHTENAVMEAFLTAQVRPAVNDHHEQAQLLAARLGATGPTNGTPATTGAGIVGDERTTTDVGGTAGSQTALSCRGACTESQAGLFPGLRAAACF